MNPTPESQRSAGGPAPQRAVEVERIAPRSAPVEPERIAPKPPSSRDERQTAESGGTRSALDDGSAKRTGRWMLGGVAAVIAAVGFFAMRGPVPLEDGPHIPNYDKVQQVTNAGPLPDGRQGIMKVDGAQTTMVGQIGLSARDADLATTAAVKAAIQANPGDLTAANQALQHAQQIPEMKPGGPAPIEPTISSGMAAEIASGSTEFFHIYLYDNCAEDGDIVKIRINGADFAMVPITHGGATLSVPKAAGQSFNVALVGVSDGGGGITVACRTSDGTFFMRAMGVGEEQTLTIVGP